MTDFLLELLSEEIPARMQAKAEGDLARLFAEQLAAAGLKAEAIETYSTPRRLALIARGLPVETQAVSDEIKGPRVSAPPQALDGFLRKTGLTREQLVERDGILFAVIEKPGRATANVLAEAIPAIIRAFPWPKSMRWGAASISTESLRWVRPLQGIVALLGDAIVPFEIAGIASGAATVGHRFHHPGAITIGGAHDYAEKLRACHVLIDPAERKAIIREGAAKLAAGVGVELIEDEGLVAENAGLTEWPVPLIGRFDQAFLAVPPEVIQLTARVNQKYFVCLNPPLQGDVAGVAGRRGISAGENSRTSAPLHHSPTASGPPPLEGEELLAPYFVCVANIEASDGGAAVVAGNERVLSARLADAKFFWEQDLKVPLEDQAKKLDQIVFHEKLGTVADKVERMAKLARRLVEEGIVKSSPGRGGGPAKPVEGVLHPQSGSPGPLHPPSGGPPPRAGEELDLAALAETAARLAKADLVTGMVGEFPELQGVIGGYLARAQGYPDDVADAIRDHYKPVGQGDEVPTAPVTVAVSLADKLDTLSRFFFAGMPPTGSKDPFALRRAALGIIELIDRNTLRLPLRKAVLTSPTTAVVEQRLTYEQASPLLAKNAQAAREILDFFADRLKVQQREAGVRHDLIDAVFALGGEDDLVRLLARVKALQGFVETPEGADLLAGYKRAANILKKEGWGTGEDSVRPERSRGALAQSPNERPSTSLGTNEDENSAQKTLSYTPEIEEAALIAALDVAEPEASAAVEREDFEGAMAALATLRGPVDAFFDKVTVNDPDPVKREARLALLARMRDAFHRVADFSKIEG